MLRLYGTIKAMMSRKIAHQTHPLVYECKQLCWSLCQNRIEVKLMWNWRTLSSTDHLRAISRVWLDRHWWQHGKQNGTPQILVGSTILFFQMWHFGPGLRGKRRREGLYALCQEFYLNIALFNRILEVDLELLQIWCVFKIYLNLNFKNFKKWSQIMLI
jgi:hypothetical protein